MYKHVYGKGMAHEQEVSVKETTIGQKMAFFCTFVDFTAGFVLLLWCTPEQRELFSLGVVLVGLMPILLMNAIRVMFSEKGRQSLAYKICRLIFPMIGVIIIASYFGSFLVVDTMKYIFILVSLLCMVIFFGLGICFFVSQSREKKLYKRCSVEVWALCENVEKKRIGGIEMTHPTSDYSYYFFPTFRYEYNGTEYVKEMENGSGDLNKSFEKGQQIKIKVNPDHPEEIFWSPVSNNFMKMMGIGFLIGGFIWLGAFFMVLYVISI